MASRQKNHCFLPACHFLMFAPMKTPPFFPMLIATGFGSGFSPIAPGTAGALVALLIWFMLSQFAPTVCLATTVLLILMFTVAGIWSTNRLTPYWGEDPSRVVVDEMVGTWLTLLAAPVGDWRYAVGAFALFRLLDILKPLGIRKMEQLPGGIGVMMDDILAGIYGFVILIAIRWWIQ